MVQLLRDVMGFAVEFAEPTTTELSLPSGDRAYFDFSRREASGPVALFEVDDIRAAHTELSGAGVETVGALERDSKWEWLHFRAPDGNLYALASRRADGD
jgi:hypothetical protein